MTPTVPSSDKDFKTFFDNSNDKSIKNRECGIYKIYTNIYLNNKESQDNRSFSTDNNTFINNLTNILEDLYDNNQNTVFGFYFFINPDAFHAEIEIDCTKLMKHLNSYPPDFILDNITNFYKNVGLTYTNKILVWFPTYDINNLQRISIKIRQEIFKKIKVINENVDKDLNNTIINYRSKVDSNSELMLFIYADFKSITQ